MEKNGIPPCWMILCNNQGKRILATEFGNMPCHAASHSTPCALIKRDRSHEGVKARENAIDGVPEGLTGRNTPNVAEQKPKEKMILNATTRTIFRSFSSLFNPEPVVIDR